MSYITLTDYMGTAEPSGAAAGVALRLGRNPLVSKEGFTVAEMLTGVVLAFRATVTAGQTAGQPFLRPFLYIPTAGDWFPLGPTLQGGSDTDRGKLNNAVALGELATGDDKIVYSTIINGLSAGSRFYLQHGAGSGTGYAHTAYLVSIGNED